MTIDQRLAELERAAHDDPEAAARLLAERHRVAGADAWLQQLATITTWERAGEPVQDAVIAEVGRRLGEAFEHTGAKVWSCENGKDKCLRCEGHGRLYCAPGGKDLVSKSALTTSQLQSMDWTHHACECELQMGRGNGGWLPRVISHRLGLFLHKATGMEFSLVPGKRSALKSAWVSKEGMIFQGPPLMVRGDEYTEATPAQVDRLNRGLSIAPLLVGRWPVVWDQWSAMGGSEDEADDPNGTLGPLPVMGISHHVATETLLQHGLRLPSPAEWEHACRAGSATRFYWGDEMDDSFVWHGGNSGACNDPIIGYIVDGEPPSGEGAIVELIGDRSNRALKQLPVLGYLGEAVHQRPDGSLYSENHEPRPHSPSEHDAAGRHNAFGLIDMIGNVWEWCSDGQARGFSFENERATIESLTPGEPVEAGHGLHRIGFRAVCSIPGLEARS